jgi:hypothetical protein
MLRKVAITLFGLFSLSSVSAATLTADSGWSTFTFDGAGSSWDDTFTFTITQASTLTVTDGYLAGDIFEVFLNGVTLGLTSPTSDTTSQIYGNYDTAAADSRWSTGVWNLLAGTYTVSGFSNTSPHGSGTAALRLDTTPVPVPAAAWLFASGIVGLLGFRHKKQS